MPYIHSDKHSCGHIQDRLRSGDSLFISSKDYEGPELSNMTELFTGNTGSNTTIISRNWIDFWLIFSNTICGFSCFDCTIPVTVHSNISPYSFSTLHLFFSKASIVYLHCSTSLNDFTLPFPAKECVCLHVLYRICFRILCVCKYIYIYILMDSKFIF